MGKKTRHGVSTSDGGLGGSGGQRDNVNEGRHPAFLSHALTGSSGSSEFNIPLTDALQGVALALHATSGARQGVSLAVVPSDVFDRSVRAAAAMPAHVHSVSELPAEAITLDGLVSTFTVDNIVPQPFEAGRDTVSPQGSSAIPTPFSVGGLPHGIPMILNFTTGEIGRNRVSAPCLANAGTTLRGATIPTTRRSRARGMRGPSNRRDSHSAQPDTVDADAPPVQEGLIEFLNSHNALVHLFRTTRDKLREADIPEFQIRLFGVVGGNQYDLPTADAIGAIVYDGGPETMTDYDVVIQRHSREAESDSNMEEQKRMTMKAYYAYQLCDRVGRHSLITQAGRLFQQYAVNAYCVIEQSRTDFKRRKQNDIRSEYLSGIYDAITRGDRDGRDVGSRIILPTSFTVGPHYMKMALTGNTDAQSQVPGPVVQQRSLAYFTDLNPTDNSKFIEARVYRKWTTMKVPNLIPTCFSCILLDKKIDPLKDNDYPYHYFSFAAYNELGGRLEKKNPILTDYIGYIHNVEKVKEYGGATGNKIKLRNIGIRNLKKLVRKMTNSPIFQPQKSE
ncbi:helitron helicase-like domain-containing protein [Artemisia annua]|uniref:Helitron helicase-like domain-containing protein n=1 Tax=Artemisia annua TaxID=35608 RepID=A0A2U1LL97_ARTAN|nr:helitron helicase-like domain-containing protein [Artemisia annua]